MMADTDDAGDDVVTNRDATTSSVDDVASLLVETEI